MSPAAGWYPVALSAGLERGTANGTHLFGRELVTWRDGDGAVHVWEDRCPHRGMRLSFGFVRDNRLACLYHGWTYDMAGQCRYIPAHPQLTPPASIKAEVYPSGDAAGMVWAYSSKSEAPPPPPGLPPDQPVTPVRSLHIDCAPETALAGLAAASLPPFLDAPPAPTHFATLGQSLHSLKCGSDEVLVGLQPLAANRTALYLVLAGEERHRGAGQKHFSAWAEGLRRLLEATSGGARPEAE